MPATPTRVDISRQALHDVTPTLVLNTKLYAPPARPEVVPRPRLCDRLTEGLHGRLSLVSAPAGFGKTTLVSTWLAECDRPAAWLSLDEEDSDPTRFVTGLVAALQTVTPGLGDGVLGALRSPRPPTTEAALTALLGELARVERTFVLVLDDYHAVDSPAVDDALGFLIEHLPPPVHLVVATREDPPVPLPRLRARGQLTELRAADLRFTPDEAARFLNEVMGLVLSTEDVDALEARTEGWVAGLQLAALSLRGRDDTARFIESFTGSHRFVADYLVEEVLERQPEHIEAFLLRTSILERLSGPLCDAVLSGNSTTGQETLEYLVSAGLFVVPLDDERRWYRYHHLFADLLRQRLHGRLADAVAGLHHRASIWFEAHDSEPEAIRHALTSDDPERAADLIERAWAPMHHQYRDAAWLGWANRLPDEAVRARPVLSAGCAWALLNAGELEDAASRLADAERLAGTPGDIVVADEAGTDSLDTTIASAQAFLASALGDAPATIRHAKRALDLLSEQDHFERGRAGTLLGLAYWARGDLEAAHETIAAGIADIKRADDAEQDLGGAYVLAELRRAQGRLHDAARTLEHALQKAAGRDDLPFPPAIILLAGLSEVRCEQGDLDAAAEHLQQSEALAERAGGHIPEYWRLARRLAGARLRAAQGDLSAAFDVLGLVEKEAVRTPFPDTRPVAAIRARLWIRQGRLADARSWARASRVASNDDLDYLREYEHITLARMLLAQNEGAEAAIQEATGLIERLLRVSEDGGRMGRVVELLVLQACALQAQGRASRALTSLERALALAEPEGVVDVFVDEGEALQRLLRHAVAVGGGTVGSGARSYARRLLSVIGERDQASGPARTGASTDLVQPLTPRETEIVRLIATGMTNQEIADHLFISLATVKRHIANAYGKLGVKSRTEAAARARELDLL